MNLVFDRGTIILLNPPPMCDLGSLPGVMWDPRAGVFRAPGWRFPQLKKELINRDIKLENRIGSHSRLEGVFHGIHLRPYQRTALDAWLMADKRASVVLPTGSGKTKLAIAAIAALRTCTLCLVPTRILLQQWIEQLRIVYTGPVGCLGDGSHEIRDITVATFESAYRWMERIGDRFELLIIDEMHHFGVGCRDEALEMSIADTRLGLTATPPSNESAITQLQNLIGPIVFNMSVDELVGSYLSKYRRITLSLELSSAERLQYQRERAIFDEVYRSYRKIHPQTDWASFVYTASQSIQGRRALNAWRKSRQLLSYTAAKSRMTSTLIDRHRDNRLLVFTADNSTAYRVSRQHLIMPITCDIGRKERVQALEKFSNGELRALVSSRVLNEGLDVPDADVAIIIGGTFGVREQTQRIGRVLRPRQGKQAIIYELVSRNTIEEFQARRRG
jgi:superfamily II DNA or RNA helicase